MEKFKNRREFMKYKIYSQDVIEWAKEYNKGKFHALLTDTPYNLDTITKRFGKKNSSPAKFGKDGVFQRSSKGFMNSAWDTDIAFQSDTWESLAEHLYPGAFCMAFSGSRTWHRMAVAIEDAGMIIHPTVFGWLNSQGFPKATNISKQIDKSLGLERPKGKLITNGHGKHNIKVDLHKQGDTGIGHWDGSKKVYNESLPASELAQIFEGHRYGLQALKPAVEPIIVFQKPYEGKPLDNIVATGAGAINIDGGRIPTQDEYVINRFDDGAKPFGNGAGHKFTSIRTRHGGGKRFAEGQSGFDQDAKGYELPSGRWPANFILDDSSAELLDAQTGVLTSGKPSGKKHANNNIYGQYKNEDIDVKGIGDSGGASRFFYNVQEQLDEADPIYYCSKVNTNERNAGLKDLPDVPYAVSDGARKSLERGNDEYMQDSIGYNRVSIRKNNHPTMKPIALAKYLATLLLPPESYGPRRLLVPFSGVGSEMIGAMQAGWEHIVGIEFTPEYVDLAHKRMEYWRTK